MPETSHATSTAQTPDCLIVFTGETFEELATRGWSGNWIASLARARSMTWFVATRSNGRTNRKAGHRHKTAFFLAQVSHADPAPPPETGRVTIYFSRHAPIDIPDAWPGIRNPIAYVSLSNLKIDPAKLDWRISIPTEPFVTTRYR